MFMTRFLKNFSIKQLLVIPVTLLMALLITAMVWETSFGYLPTYHRVENLSHANQLADLLLEVATVEARERGFTTSYLSKLHAGQSDAGQLEQIRRQRREADANFTTALEMAQDLIDEHGFGPSFASLLDNARQRQAALLKLRQRVDAAAPGQAVPSIQEWFDTITAFIFAVSDLRLAAFVPADDIAMVEYSNTMIKHALWLAGEYAGRERALVAQAIAAASPMPDSRRAELTSYRSTVEQQLAYVENVANSLLARGSAQSQAYTAAWEQVRKNFLGSYQQLREQVYAAASSGNYPLSANEWLGRSTEAINTLSTLSHIVGEDTRGRIDTESFTSKRKLIFAVLMSLASLGLAGIVYLVIYYVLVQLRTMRSTMQQVESNNDLSMRLPAEGKNELAQVAQTFNSMLGRFSQLVNEVVQATLNVTSSVSRVSSAVFNTQQGIQKESLEIDQVATAMTEMAATVREVAQNTHTAASSAEDADRAAQEGKGVVSESIAAINDLAAKVAQASEVIHQVEGDSQEISQVMEVIRNIAEQTNLLALNAAIEAARAGEQGRGFSVVADEVRTLAARTSRSTEEIRVTIERLQNRTQEAVQVMLESSESAQNTVGRADDTRQALDEIVGKVTHITQMNEQIATASEEQSNVAEEINQNINTIAQVANQTDNDARETVAASDQIGEEMERLRSLITQFRTDAKTLDLTTAKTAHLAWKNRIRGYLDGKSSLSRDQAVSHRDCVLGKWYYGEGLQRYSAIPEMQELEGPHEQLHQLIRQIIELRESGRPDEAERLYERIEPLSQTIVAMLETIEQKVQAGS